MVKAFQEGGKSNGKKVHKDEDKKAGGTSLSKKIGWLNQHGGLQDKIAYSDVIEPLTGLGQQQAEQLLSMLEQQAWTIRDPTRWLLKAVEKGVKGGGGKGKGSWKGFGKGSWEGALGGWLGMNSWDTWDSSFAGGWAAPQESSPWVSKAIGYANSSGKLKEQIQWKECIGVLSGLPEGIAVGLVKQLEGKGAEVEKPTQWLLAAARKYIKGEKKWKAGSGVLSKRIGELNNTDKLQQPVQWNDVSGPLILMDEADAELLINELEEKAAEVKNPTAWLASAARKRLDPRKRPETVF